MDKETLSNYGWIVICVLVLAVMIALATPFGSYVSSAVKSTTTGLFETNRSALNATGLINVEDQKFADKEKTADVTTTVTATIGTGMYVISGVNAGKQIIYKKHDKNSMFVTRTDMKGETKLSQDITEFRAFNKMKGFEPQEKGALMGLEMLVGLQNYKQQFSD